MKTDDFYKDIADDVEKWSDRLNYDERERKKHYLQEKNKKVINLMKDERGGKTIMRFAKTTNTWLQSTERLS